MAINPLYFQVLLGLVKRAREEKNGAILKTACLSYPDFLIEKSMLEKFIGADAVARLVRRIDSADVRTYHGQSKTQGEIFATESVLSELGLETAFFDIAELRGGEIILDLNEPLPAKYRASFDLVIDTGTLEHCFNIGVAMRSMCEMVSEKGWVLTSGPQSMMNHGFWNFSPTAYYDFMTQNGFELRFLKAYKSQNWQEGFIEIPPVERFLPVNETMTICIAQRMKMQELTWPVQNKYLGMLKKQQT